MKHRHRTTEILTLEKLLDRTKVDILGPFLGGFGTVTVHDICISGGIVGNISAYTEESDPDCKGKTGIEIEFPLFALVRSEWTFQPEDKPRVERLVKGLQILWHKESHLVIRDATGMELVLYQRAGNILDDVEKDFPKHAPSRETAPLST